MPQAGAMLLAAQSAEGAQTFLSRLEPLARFGIRVPREVLGPEDVRALEPMLSEAVRAGFLIEQHGVVDHRRWSPRCETGSSSSV